jgi:hypothetical protein
MHGAPQGFFPKRRGSGGKDITEGGRPMKIPDKVRIGGVDYSVEYVERLISGENTALCGQINYDMAVIKIEPNVQDEQGKCRTLLHEIMHGIEHHFKLSLSEDEIDNLANGMYMVIKDNPQMFRAAK